MQTRLITSISLTVLFSLSLPQFASARDRLTEQQKSTATPRVLDLGRTIAEEAVEYYGRPEGEKRLPRPPFKFVSESFSATSPKMKVIDENGVKWRVKFPKPEKFKSEIETEGLANRLLWGSKMAYSEAYRFSQEAQVVGVLPAVYDPSKTRIPSKMFKPTETAGIYKLTGPVSFKRQVETDVIEESGIFSFAGYDLKPKNPERENNENSDKNYTKSNPVNANPMDFACLKMLQAVIMNWDSQSINNSIVYKSGPEGEIQKWYFASDAGGSFGEMGDSSAGGLLGRIIGGKGMTKFDLKGYLKKDLVKEVKDENVVFHYQGNPSHDKNIRRAIQSATLDEVRYCVKNSFSTLTAGLVERAVLSESGAGATGENQGFVKAINDRLEDLRYVAQYGKKRE